MALGTPLNKTTSYPYFVLPFAHSPMGLDYISRAAILFLSLFGIGSSDLVLAYRQAYSRVFSR